uniref:Si:ch1073-390k14.1 n=1 Tax=Lepisosteus oculatus TaxID=7918 RepID=W5M8X3_LEPOC
VQQMMAELQLGELDTEEFFCLTLSLLGHQNTQEQFLELIEPLALRHEKEHMCLTTIFLEYFTQAQAPGVEEEEVEVALALSLQELGVSKQEKPQPSSHPGARESQRETPFQSGSTDVCVNVAGEASQPGAGQGVQALKATSSSGECDPRLEQLSSKGCQPPSRERAGGTPPGNTSQPDGSRSSRRRRTRKKASSVHRSPSMPRPVLVWIRRDLRLSDNPALVGSLELGAPVIPVFLWCPREEEGPGVTVAVGSASKYWLHHALLCFIQSLHKLGGHLVTRRVETTTQQALQSLVSETGADTLLANALYEPWLKERDELAFSALESQGVKCHLYHSYCLREPGSVCTEGVGLRGIGSVSHFMSCCQHNPAPGLGSVLQAPATLPVPSQWPQSGPLDQLDLAKMPRRKDGTTVDWAATIRSSWDFSEEGAHARLQDFLCDDIWHYPVFVRKLDSSNPEICSSLKVVINIKFKHVTLKSKTCNANKGKNIKLLWTDSVNHPGPPVAMPLLPSNAIRWSADRAHLKAWQRGRTGYPLVDAAMRQLWLTGWMNNYMRHVVASFLIAYLHLPWQEGYRWFQDTLVDADVAIDAVMWQNGGMCGLDHWNFVMHPVSAALTCDPYGSFVRKWCPELAALPDELIHKPWQCPASVLRRAGVTLGGDYPERIVADLEERRARSLRDVATARQQFAGEYVDRRSGCDLLPLPDKLVKEALGGGGGGEVVQRGGRFLLPVITRKEFQHQTLEPGAQTNPFDAVLRGYVSRQRDEAAAFLRERDFTASVMSEGGRRLERQERDRRVLEGLPPPPAQKSRARRTPRTDPFSVVPGGAPITPS